MVLLYGAARFLVKAKAHNRKRPRMFPGRLVLFNYSSAKYLMVRTICEV